jgi:hypothetical protein
LSATTGLKKRNLPILNFHVAHPLAYTNWSHDGKWMYAQKFPQRAVRINLADHHIELVVDLKDFPEPGPSWVALLPDDSLLLHRDRSVQEIYALTLQPSK